MEEPMAGLEMELGSLSLKLARYDCISVDHLVDLCGI